jgi:hypothetical protein
MQEDSTIVVNSPEDRNATLSLDALSFYRNRTMEISSGGAPVVQVIVPTNFITLSVPIHLTKGANTVQLHVRKGCERPSDIKELNNPDQRCLSIAMQSLILV